MLMQEGFAACFFAWQIGPQREWNLVNRPNRSQKTLSIPHALSASKMRTVARELQATQIASNRRNLHFPATIGPNKLKTESVQRVTANIWTGNALGSWGNKLKAGNRCSSAMVKHRSSRSSPYAHLPYDMPAKQTQTQL